MVLVFFFLWVMRQKGHTSVSLPFAVLSRPLSYSCLTAQLTRQQPGASENPIPCTESLQGLLIWRRELVRIVLVELHFNDASKRRQD